MSRATSSVKLSSIPTLAQLFQNGQLKAAAAAAKSSSASPSYAADVSHRVSLFRGDITHLDVDAIVNAANETLMGGGGVDGAIHRAAGKELKEACKPLNGCATGDAKVTKAFALPSKHVIHTVGPIYAKGRASESEKALRSAYRRSLEEAAKAKCKSVAFPSISTGVYGYPMDEATDVALDTVGAFLSDEQGKGIERVIFCVFSERDYNVYASHIPAHFREDE